MRTCPSPCFVDQREPSYQVFIAGDPPPHVVEKPPVDLVDNLEVTRQELTEERHRPSLERFGHQRVVRVAAAGLGDRPGRVPVHVVLVDEQPHQLGNRNRGMRVVQLDRPARREVLQPPPGRQLQANHVLQRAGDEEELLRQPQPLAGLGLVVRVQHLGDGLGHHLLVHRAVVVAEVERVEVERLGRLGPPEPQQVGGGRAEPGDRGVVGHALHAPLRDPAHAVPPVLVLAVLGASAELHVVGVTFRTRDLPGIPQPQPLVGHLDLPAVTDRLVEDAELVADAVSDGGHAQRGERIHVARGQPAEAAVAEAGLFLLLEHVLEVLPESRQRLRGGVPHPEIDAGGCPDAGRSGTPPRGRPPP